MLRGRRLAGTVAALVGGIALAVVGTIPSSATAAPAKPAGPQQHSVILLVSYHVTKDCKIHANYPVNPRAHDNAWTVHPGAILYWRYNVNSKVAMVSDPKHGFPHWGFVEDHHCLGTSVGQGLNKHHKCDPGNKKCYPPGVPVPSRILSGRSQQAGGWRAVAWMHKYGAIPAAKHTMTHNATLRDAASAFVIGNVYKGWEVRPTSVHKVGYTLVYVPVLKEWGWVQ